jgi:hypothetical protein
MGSALAAAPEIAGRFKDEAGKYSGQQPGTQDSAKTHEAAVTEHSARAERHFARHHILTIAEGVVHTAIAGASIALLAHSRPFWLVSLALTVIGIVVAGVAYLA